MRRTFRIEADVKQYIKDKCKILGAWYFMPVTYGFGKSGVPDLCIVYKGTSIWVETKKHPGKPTALQKRELVLLFKAGAMPLVIDEKNLDEFEDLMHAVKDGDANKARRISCDNLIAWKILVEVKRV